MKKLFLLSYFVLSVLGFSRLAHAYMDLSKVPELSYGVHITREKFEEETKVYKDTPDGNRLLSYEVRVPKSWEPQKLLDISNSSSLLNEVGLFYGPNKLDTRSLLKISSQKVDKLTSAEHWFVEYVMSYSYAIQGYKRVNELRVEAEYIKFDHGKTYHVRANAIRNGSRIILTEYTVPYQHWKEEKSYAIWSSILFKLKHLEGTITGGVKDQMFLDISRFSYPLDWDVRHSDIRSLDLMVVELALIRTSTYVDGRGYERKMTTDDGTLLVSAVSNYEEGDVIRERRQHFDRLEKQGFVFGDEIESNEEFYLADDLEVKEIKVVAFGAPKKGFINYELWFVEMESGGYTYLVSMVTPAREDSFDLWADNIGTLKLVLNSFEISDRR